MLHLSLFTTSQHAIVYFLGNVICYVLYVSKIPIVESARSKGADGEKWPWESLPSNEWKVLLKNSLFWNLFNSFFINPLWSLTLYVATEFGLKDNHPYLIDEMPSAMSFTAQVVFCMIFEDLTFYFSHRLLH